MALSNDVSVKVFPNRNPVWCWYSWVVVLKFCLDLELIRSHPVESHQDSRFFTRLRRNDSRNFHLLVTEPPRLKILHQAQEELSVGIKNQNYYETKTDKDLWDLIMQAPLLPPKNCSCKCFCCHCTFNQSFDCSSTLYNNTYNKIAPKYLFTKHL